MRGVTRQEIFAQAARKLRQEFQELSTVPHGEKGSQAMPLTASASGHVAAHTPRESPAFVPVA